VHAALGSVPFAFSAAVTASAAASTVTAAATTSAAAAATAAISATAAVSSTAAAAITTAAGARFLRTGFVDGQGATVVLLIVQACDGRLGFLIGSHFDETKAAATSCLAIHHDLRAGHGAKLREQFFEV
jgi:hypothetical protein